MAFAAGLIAADRVNAGSLAALLSLSLLINSKQALTLLLRSPSGSRSLPLSVFLLQVFAGLLLILSVLHEDLAGFSPYATVPIAYVLLLKLLGEHSIFTEVAGFMLLSASSLVAYYAAAGGLDHRLFITVAIFFVAGVFRVRIQFRKETFYRVLMIAYVISAAAIFRAAGFPLLLLLPLADNLLFSILLYRVGLAATGWIEMSKGLVFLVLLAYLY